MHVIVIRVRKRFCELIPVVLVIVHITSQHGRDGPIISFHLPIRLGVVGSHESVRDSELTAYGLKEIRGEVFRIIEHERSRGSVLEYPVRTKGDGQIIRGDAAQRDDLRQFREATTNHEDESISVLRFGQRT